VVRGTVLYRHRVALPPGATVRVRLEDVSRQDVAADVVAETEIVTQGEQVPILFELEVDAAALDPSLSYALRGVDRVRTRVALRDDYSHPLPPGSDPADVELVVEPVPSLTAAHGNAMDAGGARRRRERRGRQRAVSRARRRRVAGFRIGRL
jgi:putative lipoprotein